MKKIPFMTPLLCLVLPILFSGFVTCATTPEDRPAGGLDHPNLRRFKDHHINQIIITAWENIKKGNYESAALDFERLIKKDYIDDDILFGAGVAWLRQSNAKKALQYTTGAIEKNPLHFEAFFLRAQIYDGMNKREYAVKDLKQIVSMSFTSNLVCGLYFDDNDIADRTRFDARKARAEKLLGY